jgi:hypothetical protein
LTIVYGRVEEQFLIEIISTIKVKFFRIPPTSLEIVERINEDRRE